MRMMKLEFVFRLQAAKLVHLGSIPKEFVYKCVPPTGTTMEILLLTLVYLLAPPATMQIPAQDFVCLLVRKFLLSMAYFQLKNACHPVREASLQTIRQESVQVLAQLLQLFNLQTLPLIFALRYARLPLICSRRMSLSPALRSAPAHLTCLLITPPESA